jgi:hypothetical protein
MGSGSDVSKVREYLDLDPSHSSEVGVIDRVHTCREEEKNSIGSTSNSPSSSLVSLAPLITSSTTSKRYKSNNPFAAILLNGSESSSFTSSLDLNKPVKPKNLSTATPNLIHPVSQSNSRSPSPSSSHVSLKSPETASSDSDKLYKPNNPFTVAKIQTHPPSESSSQSSSPFSSLVLSTSHGTLAKLSNPNPSTAAQTQTQTHLAPESSSRSVSSSSLSETSAQILPGLSAKTLEDFEATIISGDSTSTHKTDYSKNENFRNVQVHFNGGTFISIEGGTELASDPSHSSKNGHIERVLALALFVESDDVLFPFYLLPLDSALLSSYRMKLE